MFLCGYQGGSLAPLAGPGMAMKQGGFEGRCLDGMRKDQHPSKNSTAHGVVTFNICVWAPVAAPDVLSCLVLSCPFLGLCCSQGRVGQVAVGASRCTPLCASCVGAGAVVLMRRGSRPCSGALAGGWVHSVWCVHAKACVWDVCLH